MENHFPETIMMALKDAIIKVFYKKEDMRKVLERSGTEPQLIACQDWSRYKFHIISPVVDHLNRTEEGLAPLRRILQETLAFSKCDHLLWLPDGKQKKTEAEEAVRRLKSLVAEHDIAMRTANEAREARRKKIEERERGVHFSKKLDDLRDKFIAMYSDPNHSHRGYGFEDLLYDLFALFDLQPKGPFRRTGEQIDGGCNLDGDHFLVEAKWQKDPVDLADLRDLDGAVASSLDNTLGLFISVTGFSPKALEGMGKAVGPS